MIRLGIRTIVLVFLFIASLKFSIKNVVNERKRNTNSPAQSNSTFAVGVCLPDQTFKKYSNVPPSITALKPLYVFETISFITLCLIPPKDFALLIAAFEATLAMSETPLDDITGNFTFFTTYSRTAVDTSG